MKSFIKATVLVSSVLSLSLITTACSKNSAPPPPVQPQYTQYTNDLYSKNYTSLPATKRKVVKHHTATIKQPVVAKATDVKVQAPDATLVSKIKSTLSANPLIPTNNLGINANQGQVQVNGSVGSSQIKDLITKLIKAIPGVLGIQNNITVK